LIDKDKSAIDAEMLEEKEAEGKVRKLPLEELDRDYAEISSEIEFLEEQLRCDIGGYTPEALGEAKEKIAHFRKKAKFLEIELERRKSSSES